MNLLFSIALPALAIVLLVLVVAFFAGSETAFLSITRLMLRHLQKKDTSVRKNSPAKKITFLKKDTNRLLSLILIGINFVTSLVSGLAATLAINLMGDKGATIATFVIAFILIIFGEIVPKTIAAAHPVGFASLAASPLIFLQRLLFPIVWIFSKITNFITKLLQNFFKNSKELITEDELKSLIEIGAKEGTLESSEKKMLYKIFDFTDLHIKNIMRHRSLVQFIPIDADYDEIVKIFALSGYSKLPVCDGDFSKVEGMLFYKSVLLNAPSNSGKKPDAAKSGKKKSFARKFMRPTLFVPETLLATELLQKFKAERQNFAIAIDENGSNSGIVTMDDILRAVFGRSINSIHNETPPENRIHPVSITEYLVPGDIKINDANEMLDLDLESENYTTIGGWLLEQFEELPEIGAILKKDGVIYKIEEQSQRRIQSVRITLPQAPVLK
ncbi:MAG: HlyC/CorC family transporter [Treponema sp.]|uniref:hemolysin family protein n=1 Tax=Treponema sp. TaxID=166 RepID=UPI0025DCA83D|nr:hemolysin family protein [Treponema sp.]MBQ9282863.1 HlyC/CorC family transporter [Treponema sp.]